MSLQLTLYLIFNFSHCRYNVNLGTGSDGVVASNYNTNTTDYNCDAEVESQEQMWQFEPESHRVPTPEEEISSPNLSLGPFHLSLTLNGLALNAEDEPEEMEEDLSQESHQS